MAGTAVRPGHRHDPGGEHRPIARLVAVAAWLVVAVVVAGCTEDQSAGTVGGDPELRSETSTDPASTTGTTADPAGGPTGSDSTPAGPGTAGDPVDASGGGIRWARIAGGTIYLEGTIPDKAESDRLAAEVVLVAGGVPVVNNLVVDPSSPAFVIGVPIYIEDVVLFDVNSAEIRPEFIPLLDIGARLLILQPSYTATVEAHADASGPSEYNLTLSQQRAQAVKDYVVAIGVPPERVITEGLGEADAATDATPDQQAAERRVEFFFNEVIPEDQSAPDTRPAETETTPQPPTTVADG
ncbi:MAG: OmpA family protein [Acidimicrobiales bacterium]